VQPIGILILVMRDSSNALAVFLGTLRVEMRGATGSADYWGSIWEFAGLGCTVFVFVPALAGAADSRETSLISWILFTVVVDIGVSIAAVICGMVSFLLTVFAVYANLTLVANSAVIISFIVSTIGRVVSVGLAAFAVFLTVIVIDILSTAVSSTVVTSASIGSTSISSTSIGCYLIASASIAASPTSTTSVSSTHG
jgi:hypothetical protein